MQTIKDVVNFKENGKYKVKRGVVAKTVGVKPQTVGKSRAKGKDIHDKLYVFEVIKMLLDEIDEVIITADIKEALEKLEDILKEDKKYQISIKEVK